MTSSEAQKYKHLFILVEDPKLEPTLQEKAYQAYGFLAGMKAKEVKGFVKLKESFKSCKRWKNGDGVCCQCAEQYFRILSQYQKAVTGK